MTYTPKKSPPAENNNARKMTKIDFAACGTSLAWFSPLCLLRCL